MKKVKEEFYLTLIFIGKWLSLCLGLLGILYFAIHLAYHKSYFDPRMDKFDFEITEINKNINDLKNSKTTLESEFKTTKDKIISIEVKELPEANSAIERAKKGIEKLGLRWWEKLPIPILEKRDDAKRAYEILKSAEQNKMSLVEEIERLEQERSKINESIAEVSINTQKAEMDLTEKKREKEIASVDVKGPLLWLASILGLM